MTFLTVDFGTGSTGLTTVGYVFKDSAGVNIGTRTTTGVVEIQFGFYGVDVTEPNNAEMIEWDDGATPTSTFAYDYVKGLQPIFPNWKDSYVAAFQEAPPNSALQKYLVDLHNTMDDTITAILNAAPFTERKP